MVWSLAMICRYICLDMIANIFVWLWLQTYIFVWLRYAGTFVDYDMQVCWCWCWWCWRWCYCQDHSYSELCFNMVYRKDLEETASVGRGSPVQQELEDSETEARRFFLLSKFSTEEDFFLLFFCFTFKLVGPRSDLTLPWSLKIVAEWIVLVVFFFTIGSWF